MLQSFSANAANVFYVITYTVIHLVKDTIRAI